MTTWLAPAKLNLFLHVVGRRADGYHLLQTVYQFIDIYDEIEFEVRTDGQVHQARPLAGIEENEDLTVMAARLLQSLTECRQGINISIQKKIPTGAGLGGGSSDAATTLLALNHLWDLGLERRRLAEIALQLGADVPVFVNGQNAWAQGVGEKLQRLDLKEDFYVVIIPPVHVSTAEIFSNPKLTRDAEPITIRDFLAGHGVNHLQAVTCELYPPVKQALDWLSAHGSARAKARMSGSGAAVFLRTQSLQQAKDVVESCPIYWQAYFARGLLKHPHR